MGIAKKLNASILFVFASLLLANYAVLHEVVQPKFDEIERATAAMNHERVTEAIDALTSKIRAASQDYAYRDSTYDFTQGNNTKEFIESSLTPPDNALDALGINVLLFRKLDNSVLWSAAIDPTTREPISGLAAELAKIDDRHPFLDGATDPMAACGIIQTSKGLMLVCITPILKSNRPGKASGTIVTGATLDSKAIHDLTKVGFEFLPLTGSEKFKPSGVHMSRTTDVLKTSSLISDIHGKPLAKLAVHTPRSITIAGADTVRMAMELVIAAAAAVILALWLIVNTLVVSRISKLGKHFSTAADTGELRAYYGDNSADEIGDLSRSFNGMVEQVNHLGDAAADSCYMNGISQFASTTLHSLRNGIAPISAVAWQLDKLFDRNWLEGLGTAVRLHSSPETEPAHREKLNAFLIGSMSRLVVTGLKANELAARIDRANKSVVGLFTNFETYSRSQSDIEEVGLLPLLKDAAETAAFMAKGPAEFLLPEVTASVLTSRIMLRQVMANLFMHALAETAETDEWKFVTVSLEQPAKSANRVTLRIQFAGKSLGSSELNAAFQVQNNAFSKKSGGLGLHWCANAAQQIGGTIRVSSNAPGTGTSIILTLPLHREARQEAA